MRISSLICVCLLITLSNVGCENGKDRKFSEGTGTAHALVATGTDEEEEDASVEGR